MKIGLALSGGGAMGAAHIGVLELLDQQKIKVDYISGTSAGAIVGLLYCDGGIELINIFLNELEDQGLLSRATLLIRRNETIFSKIKTVLRGVITAKDFADLKINFCCVATDLVTGEPVVLDSGDPVAAVMASAAYPGVFPSQKIKGKVYIDGGLTKNLPAGILKEHGADFIIGSSLYSIPKIKDVDLLLEKDKVDIGLLKNAIRSLDIMSQELARYEMANCDFCFTSPVDEHNWYDVHKVLEIKELGQKYALGKSQELIQSLHGSNLKKRKGFWDIMLRR